eukprot:GDKI01042401.1.p1 GENE.GDKI01042401.1~~GDKI01042401.1.p1  ORF type:complete len:115 (-),score=20.19 GDKI01042401.1:356-700(-)
MHTLQTAAASSGVIAAKPAPSASGSSTKAPLANKEGYSFPEPTAEAQQSLAMGQLPVGWTMEQYHEYSKYNQYMHNYHHYCKLYSAAQSDPTGQSMMALSAFIMQMQAQGYQFG